MLAAGSTSVCRSNIRTSPARIDFGLPELGEHSEDILRGLGYEEAELAAMKANGVYQGGR